ncbi:protein kinase domain-containing protein [Clostridium paridis]|uniref:non-specific serine/threonine protein kinase n=1 Tax=Clostridium paridis TaxID=2803863 RepID=A0A937FJ52_9CLOT|nr:protein kinase [Clostridium paridis]MBL4933172.1 protein kinase [Clostridium paridis]
MNRSNKGPTTKEIKAQSLERYNNKHEVTRKWISLNKKLNPNRDNRAYNGLIIEAISIMEYVIENILKDELEQNNFPGNVRKLKEKGYKIEQNEEYKLGRIKWYRNMGAHNTETSLQEVINYEAAKDVYWGIGTLLSKLGMLEKDDIEPSSEKLHANVGEVIGETCLLQEFVGGGGSCRVFKAHHQRLDLTVAVKEIKHEIIDRLDVANEKNMLLSLRHIGIPRIYDIIQDNHTYYLVMDYIEGKTLEENIKEMGPMNESQVIKVGIELCEIIKYLHNFKGGIIYKDLKPSNIMIDYERNIHLIDFGISERAENNKEDKKIYAASPHYASPEQLRGETCDRTSDIYSLGATLYYITEGMNPDSNGELRFKRSTNEVLVNIIEKAMDYKKENRYSSVDELIRVLEEYKSNLNKNQARNNTVKVETNQKINKKAPISKNKLIIPVVAVVVVIALAIGGTLIYNLGKKNDSINTNTSTKQDTPTTSTNNNQDSNTNSDTTSKQTQTPANTNTNSEATVGTQTTAFDGKAVLTVNSYNVDGNNLIVKGTIQNNYGKDFDISLYDIYVMGDDGTKFPLDMQTMLSSGVNGYKIVSGEKAEFKCYFSNYKAANSLTFKISKIFCFGGPNNESFTLKIK